MLPLVSDILPRPAKKRLKYLQDKVDAETGFVAKAAKATSLWDGKTGSNVGRIAFEIIVQKLTGMCVSIEICNYCEQNEANDIEHIYPKSLFPGMAFKWDNYLLACKQCNTAYKLDAFAVLSNTDDVIDIPRGTEPPNINGAFINPRMENPADFMLVNMTSFKFDLMPGIDTKSTNKAKKTIEVLQLNDRDQLVASRKAAAIYFYQRMDLLVKIWNANSLSKIEALLTPYDNLLDNTLPLAELKRQIKEGFKKDIQEYQHPSVWYAIKKIESVSSPKWISIFSTLPEALNW